MSNIITFWRGLNYRLSILAFISAAIVIISLCLIFNPVWQTNDDVAMSMIAHGYGIAAYGSPNLVFSNVLWGYVVRAIPSVNGVLGYSLATMVVLLVFGWATLYFLLRLGAGYFLSLLAVALLLILPTTFPQFTVNAGLLTVAAIVGWQVYARLGGAGILLISCLLAFLGYLIRSAEFLLVLGVALPLLPWRVLRAQRQMQIAILMLGVTIASAAAFDYWSYSGLEWRHFKEINAATSPFIDYGIGKHTDTQLLARHNYTQNDIHLISRWFFADPHLTDAKSLNALLSELPRQDINLQFGFVAINALFGNVLLPVILSALLLLGLMPRWRLVFLWVLCLVALFTLGSLGRPSQLRVYVPLASLLLIAPLMVGDCKRMWQRYLSTLTLLAALVGSIYILLSEASMHEQKVRQVQRDVSALPAEIMVSWAMSFPYQFAFPVLSNDLNSRNIRLHSLDFFTLAPFSVATAEQKAGREMVQRIRTAEGVPIIAIDSFVNNLRIYCKEHLNGRFYEKTAQKNSPLIRHVRCL